MAITYTGNDIGTFTLCQKKRERVGDKMVEVKDEKGRQVYNEFKIHLRESNCLMCAIHAYKQEHPEDPERPYRHDLVAFFLNEQHIKNIKKNYGGSVFKGIFPNGIKNIKLNLYYKESKTLLKYMTEEGLKVQCYYKEPKKRN